MTFNTEILIAEKLFAAGIVDRLYHSVEMAEDADGAKFPTYVVGNESYYIGPNDAAGVFAYLRQNGVSKIAVDARQRVSSETPVYSVVTPYRLVIFNVNAGEGAADKMFSRLIGVGLVPGVRAVAYEDSFEALVKSETALLKSMPPGPENLYAALDITITGRVIGVYDSCLPACSFPPNPICKP